MKIAFEFEGAKEELQSVLDGFSAALVLSMSSAESGKTNLDRIVAHDSTEPVIAPTGKPVAFETESPAVKPTVRKGRPPKTVKEEKQQAAPKEHTNSLFDDDIGDEFSVLVEVAKQEQEDESFEFEGSEYSESESSAEVTIDMLKDGIQKLFRKMSTGDVQKIIKQHAAGASSIVAASPEHYAALHIAIQEAIAA